MGDTAPKFATVSGRLDVTGRPPSFQAVVAAIDANPQLVRWTAVYAQRNAELLLARLKPYPDVRLAAGWRHFNETNDDAVRLTLSVPIPVFDQNQGNILSAQESLAKTQAEREANRNVLIVLAGRAYDTLQGSLRELAVLRETALPKSREASDAIAQGYGQGRFRCSKSSTHRPASSRRGFASRRRSRTSTLRSPRSKGSSAIRSHWPGRARDEQAGQVDHRHGGGRRQRRHRIQNVRRPATTEAPPKEKAERKEKAPDNRAEQDEHGADRIYITDVKLAAGGVVLAEAGPATLSDTLQFNGVLRANQEAVVQVTPRFPGIVRSIRKRIGDQVVKDEQLASIESNQSLTVYDLKAPISGTVIDRQISLGEYASEQKPAFVVADLSTIWVDLSVYRQDLKRVRIGDEVLIDPEDAGGEVKGNDLLRRADRQQRHADGAGAGGVAESRTAGSGPVYSSRPA